VVGASSGLVAAKVFRKRNDRPKNVDQLCRTIYFPFDLFSREKMEHVGFPRRKARALHCVVTFRFLACRSPNRDEIHEMAEVKPSGGRLSRPSPLSRCH
jgi:hypothetical protein